MLSELWEVRSRESEEMSPQSTLTASIERQREDDVLLFLCSRIRIIAVQHGAARYLSRL